MNLTKAKLKKLAVDPVVVDLVAEVLVSQAKAEYTKETVDAYITPVFESFEFYLSDKWGDSKRDFTGVDGVDANGKITDQSVLYLTDLESENYRGYVKACNEAHLAGPFASVIETKIEETGENLGWCPALIAESAFNKAKNKLAAHVATKWMGLESIEYPHSYKLNDIIVGLVLSGPAGESLQSPVSIAV